MKTYDFPLLIASNNAHKIREITQILGDRFTAIYCPRDLGIDLDPVEDGETFAENAYIKCFAFHQAKPDFAVLSDDSGLMVDALGGAPGVMSARYAGEHGDDGANNAKLLRELAGAQDRSARFVSSICLLFPDLTCVYGDGKVEGSILLEAQGSGGFGYDPLFFCNDLGESFGTASPEAKNSVSHRANALADLLNKI